MLMNETPWLGCTMGDLVVRAVERGGSAIALCDAHETLTFEGMGERIAGFVAALADAGLQPGDSIAQLSRNRIDAVCVLGAAFVLGLRYTPLHPLASEADQAFILEDAEIDCLVVDERNFSDRAERLRARLSGDRWLFSHGAASFGRSLRELCPARPGPLASSARASDIGLIAYTGGTTGKSKGVVHRHRSLVANVLISLAEWDWNHPERFLAVTPISHAAFLFLLPVWLKGGAVYMSEAFSAQTFAQTVKSQGITSSFLVPTMIYALLDDPQLDPADLRSLQTIVYGAAAISPPRLAEAIRRIGPKFAQLYGQTEAPNAVAMLFKRHHDLDRPERLASCGAPLAGLDVRLLDEAGRPAEPGEVGEICVRGPLVMDEYWKRPHETAEALQGQWLHTGDLARADAQGFLTIVDRRKDMLISGGFNVYPREVEDALVSHPAVAQACVVGLPDERWGEAVAALVVLKPSAVVSGADLVDHVKRLKGSIQAPKVVRLAHEIPLTSLGKPDKRAALALLLETVG